MSLDPQSARTVSADSHDIALAYEREIRIAATQQMIMERKSRDFWFGVALSEAMVIGMVLLGAVLLLVGK